MEALRRFFAVLVADLRERSRSPRFWIVLALVTAATWWSFPARDAGYLTVSFNGEMRGEYSSAWIGTVVAMLCGTFLSLLGFYLIRGTLTRDIETRVWQLLVATPMTRAGFLLAKWASHLLVLSLMAVVALAVGLVAQYVRAEDRHIDLWELSKPVLWLSLPSLAVTAMFAVWFDLLPWLRRTGGNVLFFFVWIFLTTISIANLDPDEAPSARNSWLSDPNGLVVVSRDVARYQTDVLGQKAKFGFSVGSQAIDHPPTLMPWRHWEIRPGDMLGRLFWLAFGVGGVLLAVPFLDRAAARATGVQVRQQRPGLRLRWLDKLLAPLERRGLGLLAIAELKLALRQRGRLWWLVLLVALGMQLFAPVEGMMAGLLLAWLLPLDVYARNVLRERDTGTSGMVFSAAGISRRLLASRVTVGLVLAWGLTLPALLRLSATQPAMALAVFVVGASIVLWGLALGALCRNPRPFELVMVAAAYIALQGGGWLDVRPNPWGSVGEHALVLPLAAMLVMFFWPRLRRV